MEFLETSTSRNWYIMVATEEILFWPSECQDGWLLPMLVLELFRYILISNLPCWCKNYERIFGCPLELNHFNEIFMLEATNLPGKLKIKIVIVLESFLSIQWNIWYVTGSKLSTNKGINICLLSESYGKVKEFVAFCWMCLIAVVFKRIMFFQIKI